MTEATSHVVAGEPVGGKRGYAGLGATRSHARKTADMSQLETLSDRAISPRALAAIFLASGLTHVVRPQVFEAIMPRALPQRTHRALIYLSGAAELVCGAGLLRRRRWAGTASALVLAAVFPANVQMALDAGHGRQSGLADNRILAWGRLPFQIPMLRAALNARSAGT